MKDIWGRLHDGEAINMRTDADFRSVTMKEMVRSLTLCSRINTSEPYGEATRKMEEELFENTLPKESNLLPPMEIDYGHTVKIAKAVFINHSVTMSAAAGIEIEEGVMIAPHVSLLTVNHDLRDKAVVICKPILIKRNAWIGANATILPGVSIGENAVVGACSVVTKDIPDNAVVVGNPARVLKYIDAESKEGGKAAAEVKTHD